MPASDFYTWTFPGAPVRIHLRLSVVERLSSEVKRGFGAASPNVEIGGLLIGTVDLQAHSVTIEDYEPFLSEQRSDHRFVISASAGSKLEMTLRRHRAKPYSRVSVVGYYRSHIGDGLGLSEADLALAHACFRDPANVFLLIKPSTEGSATAGFFFWEHGHIVSEFSFLEFPFDRCELAGAWIKPYGISASQILDAAQTDGERAFDEVLPAAVPLAAEESAPAERHNTLRSLRSPLFAALLLAPVVLVYPAYVAYTTWAAWWTSAPNVRALALQVERHEDKLQVSWNRDSQAVKRASKGLLSIRDGDSPPRELALDGEQLRNGSVMYGPADDRVEVRLEVTGQDVTSTSETILADATEPRYRLPPTPASEGQQVAKSSSRNRGSHSSPTSRSDSGGPNCALPAPPSQATTFSPQAFALVEELVFSQPKLMPPLESPPNAITPQPPLQRPAMQAFVGARPTHESQPKLRPEVRATVTSEVEVRVKVNVDVSGRVVNVDLVGSTAPVSSALVKATREAAKQWRFAPATRGNQPMASEVVLVFRYIPSTGGN
jgi:TonB family protein